MKQPINLEKIDHVVKQLRRIERLKAVSVLDVAKELKMGKVELLDFLDSKKENIKLAYVQAKNGKKILSIEEVYPDKSDNPEQKELYIDKRKKQLEKTISLSEMSNYGSIEGYFIEEDKDILLKEYRNTKEKVEIIKNLFNLPVAKYWIGGFGDSSLITTNGFRIEESHIKELKQEGWTILPENHPWNKEK